MPAATQTLHVRPSLRDYLDLFKPRVMSLVVFTGFVGLWLAPGEIGVWTACLAIVCIALNAGAAGAVNMWSVSYTHLTLPTKA